MISAIHQQIEFARSLLSLLFDMLVVFLFIEIWYDPTVNSTHFYKVAMLVSP